MVTAYIMVKANTGQADRLMSQIVEIEGVVDAHIVAGDVDLIVKADVEGPEGVKEIAAAHIQQIEGVEGTETYLAMD